MDREWFWWLLLVWLALRLPLRAPPPGSGHRVLVAALFLGALSWTAVQAIQYRTRPNAVIVADEPGAEQSRSVGYGRVRCTQGPCSDRADRAGFAKPES
ncbi:MAG: hypothetical protein R3E12_14515 [Candidatus Eisenbacteria bacterium]